MIIAIEGQSYAGKTTLINKLLKQTGIKSVPELIDYCGGPAAFPPEASNQQEAISNDRWFLSKEKERLHSIKEEPRSIFLVDRWFLSGLAYAYARDCITGYQTFNEHYNDIRDALKNHELYLPSLIYIKLPIKDILARQSQKTRPLDEEDIPGNLMRTKTRELFITRQEQFYNILTTTYTNSICVLDGRDELECNAREVLKWICNSASEKITYELPDISKLFTDT